MLYIFYGTNTHKVADRANALVRSLCEKRPDVLVHTFSGALEDTAPLDELVEARGLFVEKHVVVLRGLCEQAESRERVFTRLPHLAASENIFVLVEGGVHPAHKKVFAEHAHKHEEHNRTGEPRRMFDEHGLVAALKRRDRRALWVAYVRAQRGGESPEAISGLLHFGVKDMLAAPARYAQVYTHERLRMLSRELIERYHEAHRGRGDLATALERWVLSL